jgi:hypothetical protein
MRMLMLSTVSRMGEDAVRAKGAEERRLLRRPQVVLKGENF